MIGIDRPGGYIEKLRDEGGIIVNLKKVNKLLIPKYTGVISSKYMFIER